MTNLMALRIAWICLVSIILLCLFVFDNLFALIGWITALVFYTVILLEKGV